MNETYQPEKWVVLKDDICTIRSALHTAMTHIQDRLAAARIAAEEVKHPSMATRLWIKKLEDDTQTLFVALGKIDQMPLRDGLYK
jgi:hypothetical protein